MASIKFKNQGVSENGLSYTEKELYSLLRASGDIKILIKKIVEIIGKLGLSDFTFVPLERELDYEVQQGTLSTLPDEYHRQYRINELSTHDMLVSFFRETTHPSYTSHIYNYYCDAPFESEITRVNRAIRQLQHSFGFLENYVVPITSRNESEVYLFILSQQNTDPAAFQVSIKGKTAQLRALGKAILKVCNTKFPTQLKRPPAKIADLAPKPLRVLSTLANNDLSINEVADKLCISPITAHQQIAVARKAFNKSTNIAAIKEAIAMGLIKFEYDD